MPLTYLTPDDHPPLVPGRGSECGPISRLMQQHDGQPTRRLMNRSVRFCLTLATAVSFATASAEAAEPSQRNDTANPRPPAAAPPSAPTLIEHDPATGKVSRVLDARGEFRYRYDSHGRLLEASRMGDGSVQLAYDEMGRIMHLSLHASNGTMLESLQAIHDAEGRIIGQILAGRGALEIRRDTAGKVLAIEGNLDEDGRRTIFGLYGRLQMLRLPAEQAQYRLRPPSQ